MDQLSAALFAARYWAARLGAAPNRIPQPFVILAGPRSGSTLLQKSLDQHGAVQCLHELAREALKTPHFSRYFLGRRRALARLRAKDERAFLLELFSGVQPLKVQALGFKALYTQPSRQSGNWEPFWTALGDVPGLRVVHLRRNRLESVLSLQLAIKDYRFVGSQYEKTPVDVDPKWVLMRMRKDANLEATALEHLRGVLLLEIDYLALIMRSQQVCDEVFSFLGVSPEPVGVLIRRQRSQGLIDFISNWESVRDSVLHSEFAHELQTFEAET